MNHMRRQLERRVRLVERDVYDAMRSGSAPALLAIACRDRLELFTRSPFQDGTTYRSVRLHIESYPGSLEFRFRLAWALVRVGVVGRTGYGWLYVRQGTPAVLREATGTEVAVLPHLPDDWQSFLENSDLPLGGEDDHAALLRLLAPFQLRDGHAPARPFTGRGGLIGPGWHGIVKELVEDLIRLGWNREVLQIKEKFGTLRFYVADRDERLQARIIAAREHSAEICERCGKGGTTRLDERGWYRTRCERCGRAGRP